MGIRVCACVRCMSAYAYVPPSLSPALPALPPYLDASGLGERSRCFLCFLLLLLLLLYLRCFLLCLALRRSVSSSLLLVASPEEESSPSPSRDRFLCFRLLEPMVTHAQRRVACVRLFARGEWSRIEEMGEEGEGGASSEEASEGG